MPNNVHADAGESARAAVCASVCVRQFGMGLAGCKEFLSAACTKCELCDDDRAILLANLLKFARGALPPSTVPIRRPPVRSH